jgi:hypothetical protein
MCNVNKNHAIIGIKVILSRRETERVCVCVCLLGRHNNNNSTVVVGIMHRGARERDRFVL